MIRAVWGRIRRLFSSAKMATWLLAILGVWSIVGTLVPQTVTSEPKAQAWDAAHSVIAPAVRILGLHFAFTAPLFLVAVGLLGISTAFCAWERTKVAVSRARRLREAALSDKSAIVERHDLEIECNPTLSEAEVLTLTSETLASLGVKTRRRDSVVSAVSTGWSAWGSPVFHWALLGLIVALILGNATRSDGLMGIAVGQTKPDAPASYGKLSVGPLRRLGATDRSIRLDGLEPDYQSGGIDRGPTPMVTLLDGNGKVIKTQRVYPNATLKSGALTIYPSDYGLSVNVTIWSASGARVWQGPLLVDFAAGTPLGTRAVDFLPATDPATNQPYRVFVTVPLDQVDGVAINLVPKSPSAHIDVVAASGVVASSTVLSPGQRMVLPGGVALELDSVNYYARLSLIDDWSIPALLVGLIVALVGLTGAVMTRQQIILFAVIDEPEGSRLVGTVRLWRNAASSRHEIESALSQALASAEKGNMT